MRIIIFALMPTPNPMEKTKRATIGRWLMILSSLRTESPPPGYSGSAADWTPNARQFARVFECHPKTIQRDINELRACGYELDFDRSERRLSWINKEGVETLPLMAATEEEVISLMTALAISSSVLDAATARHLHSFLKKLEQHIQGGFLHPMDVVERMIHFKHVWISPKDTTIWTRLQRAILDQRGITLEYASPFEENRPRPLKLLPLMLASLEGIWYLYAMKFPLQETPESGEVHLYRLNRMHKVRTGTFHVPGNWDRKGLLERIAQGVGAWQGGPEEGVRLRISADKIGFMKERAWHPGHTFTQQDDGSWILSFNAAQVEHLVPFILQWAPDIEVLEPEHLRSEVAWTARQAAKLHGAD